MSKEFGHSIDSVMRQLCSEHSVQFLPIMSRKGTSLSTAGSTISKIKLSAVSESFSESVDKKLSEQGVTHLFTPYVTDWKSKTRTKTLFLPIPLGVQDITLSDVVSYKSLTKCYRLISQSPVEGIQQLWWCVFNDVVPVADISLYALPYDSVFWRLAISPKENWVVEAGLLHPKNVEEVESRNELDSLATLKYLSGGDFLGLSVEAFILEYIASGDVAIEMVDNELRSSYRMPGEERIQRAFTKLCTILITRGEESVVKWIESRVGAAAFIGYVNSLTLNNMQRFHRVLTVTKSQKIQSMIHES